MKEKVVSLKRDLIPKLNLIFIEVMVRVKNLRMIYMKRVMQEINICLSLDHGLNEILGRHRRSEGKTKCSLSGNECENVSHVLWECSAYSSTRASFMKKLQKLLKDDYEGFESLENIDKSFYVLGSELWEN